MTLPLWSAAIDLFNKRDAREKAIIVLFLVLAVLWVDNAFFIQPTLKFFVKTAPQLSSFRKEHQSLKDDRKNSEAIKDEWVKAKNLLEDREKGFIRPTELPVLLESLSGLALDSGVKIISLKPKDDAELERRGSYARVPINIRAVAGTHELGQFMAKMENGDTFFRVINLEIRENPTDLRRHSIELDIEAYEKS